MLPFFKTKELCSSGKLRPDRMHGIAPIDAG
jgi:hypothetical protein